MRAGEASGRFADRSLSSERNGRTLVLGDVHGAFRALQQVLHRGRFDPAADRLISLGDICDRGSEVDRCLDLLVDVPDLTLVLGNHDEWALEWMRGAPPLGWFGVGGDGTVDSYARRLGVPPPLDPAAARALGREVPESHRRLLCRAVAYRIEERADGRVLFVHAGWNPNRPDDDQTDHDLRLGRELWTQARLLAGAGRERATSFDTVFIGHTRTDWSEPRPVLEVWSLDQGAGWGGPLS